MDVAAREAGTLSTLREVFAPNARTQRYLDVEAALALAEEELGIIPAGAGRRIAAAARLELIDRERLAADRAVTGHLMMPIVSELARVVGEPDGGWVHWGATTQNIQQVFTGIVAQIKSLDEVIAEIATASKEQSQSISEVNMAVSQMDKVTQSNAAAAEENAASATTLHAQSARLLDAVGDLHVIIEGEAQASDNPSVNKSRKTGATRSLPFDRDVAAARKNSAPVKDTYSLKKAAANTAASQFQNF